MNAALINKRIGCVDTAMASIVGIAAWCALHADHSDAILQSICTRMEDASVAVGTKVSLMYLIHEMMLSCAVDGCSEGGKKALSGAVAQRLPLAVEALGPREELAELHEAVLQITEWWSTLNIISLDRLKAIRKPALKYKKKQKGSASSSGSAGGGASHSPSAGAHQVPPLLRNVAALLSRFEDSKQRLTALEGSQGASDEDIVNAKDDCKRRLRLLLRSIDGQQQRHVGDDDEEGAAGSGGGGGLLQLLQGELDSLTASGPAETIAEQDDILGSFF